MPTEAKQQISPFLYRENPQTGITYHRRGEYWLPNLTTEAEKPEIGKWGRMWILFMRENHNALYNKHLIQGDLYTTAMQIQTEAEEQILIEAEAIVKSQPKSGTFLSRVKTEETAHLLAEEETVRNLVYQVR